MFTKIFEEYSKIIVDIRFLFEKAEWIFFGLKIKY
jgi:hypothetical protein